MTSGPEGYLGFTVLRFQTRRMAAKLYLMDDAWVRRSLVARFGLRLNWRTLLRPTTVFVALFGPAVFWYTALAAESENSAIVISVEEKPLVEVVEILERVYGQRIALLGNRASWEFVRVTGSAPADDIVGSVRQFMRGLSYTIVPLTNGDIEIYVLDGSPPSPMPAPTESRLSGATFTDSNISEFSSWLEIDGDTVVRHEGIEEFVPSPPEFQYYGSIDTDPGNDSQDSGEFVWNQYFLPDGTPEIVRELVEK